MSGNMSIPMQRSEETGPIVSQNRSIDDGDEDEEWRDTRHEALAEEGVIFVTCSEGLKEHEEIFRPWFGKVIPTGDNKFSALNSAVMSGGSFIYIPKGVKVKHPLQLPANSGFSLGGKVTFVTGTQNRDAANGTEGFHLAADIIAGPLNLLPLIW